MTAKITNPGPPVSPEQLQQVEKRLGLQLPDDYRSFLLTHNGGVPRPGWVRVIDTDDDYPEITRFWPADEMETETLGLRSMGVPKFYLSIGAVLDESVLTLSLSPEYRGAVFWNPNNSDVDPTEFVRLANSFNELLARLDYVEYTKPWMMLIDNNDLAGLRDWLDAGGSAQAEDVVVLGISALDHASFLGRHEIVELLLAHGAKPRKPWWKFWG